MDSVPVFLDLDVTVAEVERTYSSKSDKKHIDKDKEIDSATVRE